MKKMTMNKWEGSKGDIAADKAEGKHHKEGSANDEAEDAAAVRAENAGRSGYKAHLSLHKKHMRAAANKGE